MSGDFLIGFLFGSAITFLLGWIWLLYRDWVRARDAYNRPQVVVQPTPKTPAQVRRASAQAELKINLVRLGILLILWLLVEILFPDIAYAIRMFLVRLWRLLFGI
ncbi:MAG: hypothetical protein R2867_33245 [Caldilineaceae bacterium]